jgi:hypothetical protein
VKPDYERFEENYEAFLMVTSAFYVPGQFPIAYLLLFFDHEKHKKD